MTFSFKKICCVLGLFLISLPCFAENPKSAKAIIPIFSEKLSFQIPLDWKPASKNNQPGSFIIEFIPTSDSLEKWTSLLSIQGFKGLSHKVSPQDFVTNVAFMHRKICPKSVIYVPLESDPISNHETSAAIIGCGEMPDGKQGEVGYFIAIKGENDLYFINKSKRSKPFLATSSPVTKENVTNYFSEFTPLDVCKAGGKENECLH